jgi:outer membrane protein assembly factor BamB
MKEPEQKQRARRLFKGWRVVLAGILLVSVVLAGVLFVYRHQIHQFIRGATLPPEQTVTITPLALSPGALSATPAPEASTDWTTYHANNQRSGYVTVMPDPTSLSGLWKRSLDGAVYGEPLVVGNEVIVVTENDSLYALNALSGQIIWHTNVGRPVPLADLPCGNIDPLGITSTPVYDPQTGLIFAVAEVTGPAHILLGLDAQTGQVKVRRIIDPASINPLAYQQRAALVLSQGKVYITFGGLAGDCGAYRGLVVASSTSGQGPLLTYQVPTPREGGIWEPAGPTVDAQGNLYVSVGNGEETQGSWDHSDSILKLSPTLQLEDAFAPASWAQDNAADLDLSSLGAVFLPGGLIFIQGKSQQGYVLRADQLGGINGQIQSISVCSAGAYGGAAVNNGIAFIPCADGLREIKLTSSTTVGKGWQAPSQVTGSPVIGGNTVYSLDPAGGTLYALNAGTGATRASISVGTTSRFATPTLFQHNVYVGTMTGIVAVSIAS